MNSNSSSRWLWPAPAAAAARTLLTARFYLTVTLRRERSATLAAVLALSLFTPPAHLDLAAWWLTGHTAPFTTTAAAILGFARLAT
jgi:hypothetical protein